MVLEYGENAEFSKYCIFSASLTYFNNILIPFDPNGPLQYAKVTYYEKVYFCEFLPPSGGTENHNSLNATLYILLAILSSI